MWNDWGHISEGWYSGSASRAWSRVRIKSKNTSWVGIGNWLKTVDQLTYRKLFLSRSFAHSNSLNKLWLRYQFIFPVPKPSNPSIYPINMGWIEVFLLLPYTGV
jgi:hypothetical protein